MARRIFTMLENNPEVMTKLGHNLGLSRELAFYDVYSLDDPELLALVPRPVTAVLAILPATKAWLQSRQAEDDGRGWYEGVGPAEPVLWFRQTIPHGCGLIGLLHCAFNGAATTPTADADADADATIVPGSLLDAIRSRALPLTMHERADVLATSDRLYEASEAAAVTGDSRVLPHEDHERLGQHFVAFVKGRDGHLWELEGARKGPLDRGPLGADEDALSPKALELGIKRVLAMQGNDDDEGDVRFSLIALGPRRD
ncbi:Peptidase C12, ubiquitin carboxyl-terminal hydrolase 1 [Niveomyces insectorum RCEF 264]|uniref:Ubiquitin carboxyl-terminal hydrolase n=1 Tax=Niveomyces insectorum RCEF 264 TaxID=1081102 RepID=A0A162JEV2_9HYPO|nr:Peptidase C12, ubiquitin carboxyl-terminal hydrolase 1 [Niveomyces insectorum RCEF 264]